MKITIRRGRNATGSAWPGARDLRKAGAKTRANLALLSVCAIMLLASCDVKDPIFNTPHPDHGMVTLTTDWSGIGEGLTAPESYTVTAGGDYSATLTGVTNKLDHLFAPGDYRFCIYNTAEHITVSGTTASVARVSGGVDGADGFVEASPGWLFSCVKDVAIVRDTEQTLTAVMQQQVRRFTLVVSPAGDTADGIERIEGYLSGAASTLDMADGTHAAPMNVELAFSKIASGGDAGKWSATVRLLGIAGSGQKLYAKIYFAGGNPAPVTLESDLAGELADFNSDKSVPLTLDGKVVETPTGAGFTATIDDWSVVSGGSVTAD